MTEIETRDKLRKKRMSRADKEAQQRLEEKIKQWERIKFEASTTRERERELRLEVIELSSSLKSTGEGGDFQPLEDGRTIATYNRYNYRIVTPIAEFFNVFSTLPKEARECIKLRYEIDAPVYRVAPPEIQEMLAPHLVKTQAMTRLYFYEPYDKQEEQPQPPSG